MRFGWTLTALTVAALGTACSSNELQSVDIESPFTCGQMNAQLGNPDAYRLLRQQERLIAGEISDDRPANYYFKHALVGATELTTPDHNAYSQHRLQICAKFPSKGINDAITEAANLTFAEKGGRLIVQKCSALENDSVQFEELVQGWSNRINAHGLEIDMTTEAREALIQACSSNPDQMIASVIPKAEYSLVRIYNEKRNVLEQQEFQSVVDEYIRQHGNSLLVGGDVSCEAYNARREEQDRLNWQLQEARVDTKTILNSDIKAVIEANFTGDDLLYFKRDGSSFLDLCGVEGITSFKAAAVKHLSDVKSTFDYEIFKSHVATERERDPNYSGETASWP